jgi:rhodanese-related sulfurtransferase
MHCQRRQRAARLGLVGAMALAAATAHAAPSTPPDPAAGERQVFEQYRGLLAGRIAPPEELKRRLDAEKPGSAKIVVAEVRPLAEFEAGHIPGSVHVGKPHLVAGRWSDPDIELWIFSRTFRSAVYVAGVVTQYGFKNVHVVEGGLAAWVRKGYPLENRYLGEIKVSRPSEELARQP